MGFNLEILRGIKSFWNRIVNFNLTGDLMMKTYFETQFYLVW
jgi:hypothetical protein